MFISVKQKYTRSDNRKIILHFLKKSRIMQGGMLFLFFPLIAAYLTGILVDKNGLNIKALMVGLAFPIIAILAYLYINSIHKKRGTYEGRFIIDDYGVKKQNDTIEFKKSWGELSHWTETNDFIFIYFQGVDFSAFAIQKKLIGSFEEYDQLTDYLAVKLIRK